MPRQEGVMRREFPLVFTLLFFLVTLAFAVAATVSGQNLPVEQFLEACRERSDNPWLVTANYPRGGSNDAPSRVSRERPPGPALLADGVACGSTTRRVHRCSRLRPGRVVRCGVERSGRPTPPRSVHLTISTRCCARCERACTREKYTPAGTRRPVSSRPFHSRE